MPDDDVAIVEEMSGKVAQIVNARQVILNRGHANGLRVGDYVVILDSVGQDVRDPESGEVIGSISIVKASLRIMQTEPHLSIASTFRSETEVKPGRPGSTMSAMSRLFEPGTDDEVVTVVETLKAQKSAQLAYADDLVVEVGDTFQRVTREEAEAAPSRSRWV